MRTRGVLFSSSSRVLPEDSRGAGIDARVHSPPSFFLPEPRHEASFTVRSRSAPGQVERGNAGGTAHLESTATVPQSRKRGPGLEKPTGRGHCSLEKNGEDGVSIDGQRRFPEISDTASEILKPHEKPAFPHPSPDVTWSGT